MEERATVPFWKHAFIYGAIMAAVSIFLTLAFYFTGLYLKPWSILISIPIGIAVLVVLMKAYRDDVRGGYASFGQMFGMILTASMISVVISLVFSLIQVHILFPDMQEAIRLNIEERIYNNPRISESMADAAIERASRSMEPKRQIISALLGGLFLNGIIALIVAAIMKREEDIPQV